MYHLSKLKNGITLIIIPVSGTRATTVLAMFPIGSRYETAELSGASHFVEHLLFKGTDKRPSTMDLSKGLEAAGAEYNAFTNKDYTGYYVKIDGAKQELAFDLLSDMIYHSKLDPKEVDKERGAIVEELRMYQDNPAMKVDLLFDKLLFGNCPMGWDIGGTPATVRAVSRGALWKYYQTHYSPKNMVLVVSGHINKKKLPKYIQYFSHKLALREAKNPQFYKTKFIPVAWPRRTLPLTERVVVEYRSVDQAQVILGFPGIPNNHPDRYAASLLLTILGVGMTSRLFSEVREKRGLAYMIRAASATFRDVGVVYVQAGLDPARLPEALSVIKAELARIAVEPVTAQELADAKTSIAGRLALSLEDSSTQAEWYAKHCMFGATTKLETPAQLIKKLNAVSASQIQKVAARLFVWPHARFALIGPLKKEKVLQMVK